MYSGFDKIRLNNCTLYVNKHFRNNTFEQVLAAGEKELQKRYQLTTIAASKFARVYRFTADFGGTKKEVYFKRYLYRSLPDFLKHLFRAGRAERAFKAALMLTQNSLDSPAVIAIGEHKAGLFNAGNFLVTLEVENARRIYQFISDSPKNLTIEQLRNKRSLIRAFGQTVGKMHKAGIFHGDLRLGNVLARQDENGWQFFFIDNERTRKFYRLPNRLRLKNMVQINMYRTVAVTNTDRMRFFTAYLAKNPSIISGRNEWAKKIIAKTNRRLAKKI